MIGNGGNGNGRFMFFNSETIKIATSVQSVGTLKIN